MIRINVCASKKEKLQAYMRVYNYHYNRTHVRVNNAQKCREWRDKNPTYEADRYRVYRDMLKLYLMSHPCVDCGQLDVRCLQFDHVRGVKEFTVTQHCDYSWERLSKEIEKCDIRCANCHSIRHYGN